MMKTVLLTAAGTLILGAVDLCRVGSGRGKARCDERADGDITPRQMARKAYKKACKGQPQCLEEER